MVTNMFILLYVQYFQIYIIGFLPRFNGLSIYDSTLVI